MITFGIITNGKRPEKLLHQVETIRALGIPDYEIYVAGRPPAGGLIPGVNYLYAAELADAGRLGAMRNFICDEEVTNGDILSITDDDIYYSPDWYKAFEDYQATHEDDWDVMCSRMLNPDGTRNWDWVTKGGPRGHTLLEYWETDPYLYVTGGRILMKRSVWDTCKWDYDKGFNQEEDIDFSRKLQAAGKKIVMNKHMTVIHDDPRYTSKGHLIYMTGGESGS